MNLKQQNTVIKTAIKTAIKRKVRKDLNRPGRLDENIEIARLSAWHDQSKQANFMFGRYVDGRWITFIKGEK